VKINELREIEGVVEVLEHNDSYEVKIKNDEQVSNVFEYVSRCQNIKLFDVKLPSLNEIFVSKVGKSYEE